MRLQNYITKTVPFKYRGIDFTFALSQGLFSSAEIDSGTRLLLRVLSRLLDEDASAAKPLPRYVLDCGCGTGVIGICAAAAIRAMGGDPAVRSQDRDELARLISSHNAAKNGIPASVLEAWAEPLLAGPSCARQDLILSNIPAKAGIPVLKDFVRRSTGLLNCGGRAAIVVVHTLADFFREQIAAASGELLCEEKSAEHSVFIYSAGATGAPASTPVIAGPRFLERHPFYVRARLDYTLENIPLHLETVHGAPGFDAPGSAVFAAIKLIRRLGPDKIFPAQRCMAHNEMPPLLVHEPGQGFFPCWLLEFLRREAQDSSTPEMALSGRNILSLEAARHNVDAGAARPGVQLVPAVDLQLGAAELRKAAGRRFAFIAAFPELLPQSALSTEFDQLASLWEALPPLLAEGGVFIAAFSSVCAERFDRKKPAGFTRLGDIKRKGFRALGYRFDQGCGASHGSADFVLL